MTVEKVGPLSRVIASLARERIACLRVRDVEVARTAGLSQATMSRILRAERVMTTEEFDLICSALGLDSVEVLKTAAERAPARRLPEPISSPLG